MEAHDTSSKLLYEPLETGWFRLLHLKPSAEEGSEIHCDLVPYAVDSAPPYYSLSYTWGPDDNLRWIEIKGKPTGIRSNLWSALNRFRKPQEEICMWVDALCINQESIPERNQQIAIMSRFYAESQETLVWLGDSADDDRGALSLFPVLKRIAGHEDLSQEEYFLASSFRKTPLNIRQVVIYVTRIILRLCHERPYWKRVWIIQEIALSRKVTVFCGNESLDWVLLEECITMLPEKLPVRSFSRQLAQRDLSHTEVVAIESSLDSIKGVLGPLVLMRSLQKFRNVQGDQSEQLFRSMSSLPYLMITFRDSEATDLRDKIFALLGVSSSSHGLKADYSKGVREIYIEATRSFIQNSGRLDAFWWLTGNREEILGSEFPSWVLDPRFIAEKTDSVGLALCDDDLHQREFFATGRDSSKYRAKVEFIKNGNTLSVNGLLVDEIRFVSNSPPSRKSRLFSKNNDLAETITSWHDVATLKQEDAPYCSASCNKSEAFWRTILQDKTIENSARKTSARLPKVLTKHFRIPPSSQAE